jgi:hypothetical protein
MASSSRASRDARFTQFHFILDLAKVASLKMVSAELEKGKGDDD